MGRSTAYAVTIALALGAAATLSPRLLAQTPPRVAADRPVERTDANSQTAHAQLVDKARSGRIDVYFVADSITRRWGALDYPAFLQNWTDNFRGWNAANFGSLLLHVGVRNPTGR